MRIVIALDGDALRSPDASRAPATLRQGLYAAARLLAPLATDNELLIVSGLGLDAALGTLADHHPALAEPYRLADLVAESQGLVGSWLQQDLINEHCPAVALLTEIVAADEPAPEPASERAIGVRCDDRTARHLAEEQGWTFRREGVAWRRTVPVLRPVDVVNVAATIGLLRAGYVVTLVGGAVPMHRCGGHPPEGRGAGLEQIDAVVDNDRVAGLVADLIGADLLVVLGDGDPNGVAAEFARGGRRRRAAVGTLADLDGLIAGSAGTQLSPAGVVSSW